MSYDKIKIAYAAGLIDGEGSITLNLRAKNGRGQMPALYVTVRMTDARVIGWMHQYFGGFCYQCPPPRSSRHRQQYAWGVSAVAACDLLRALLPYLIVKKSQAELAIAFRSICGYRGQRLSADRLKSGNEFAVKMSVLNRRGASA